MPIVYSQPILIDSSAIGLLLEPKMLKFRQKFGQVRHCISSVTYWEYMRGCTARMRRRPNKDDFAHWASHQADVIAFDVKQEPTATAIYHALAARWKSDPNHKYKLARLHADIMIAATALERGLPVLTDDLADWADIWSVVRAESIGPLRDGFGVLDPKDIL